MSAEDNHKDLKSPEKEDRGVEGKKAALDDQTTSQTNIRPDCDGNDTKLDSSAVIGSPGAELASEDLNVHVQATTPTESGSGDHSLDISTASSSNTDNPDPKVPPANPNDNIQVKNIKESTGASKFDEGGIMPSADDLDSENQDEELVLKWEDDEEENFNLNDDESNILVSESNKLCDVEKSDKSKFGKDFEHSVPTLNPENKPDLDKKTNSEETNNQAVKTIADTVKDCIEITSSSSLESIPGLTAKLLDPEKSDDTEDTENYEVLSEIDAQIAELEASISKAENEKSDFKEIQQRCSDIDTVNDIPKLKETVNECLQNTEETEKMVDEINEANVIENQKEIDLIPDESCSVKDDCAHAACVADSDITTGDPEDDKTDEHMAEKAAHVNVPNKVDNKYLELKSSDVNAGDNKTITDEKSFGSPKNDNTFANSTQIMETSSMETDSPDKSYTSVLETSIKPREHGLIEPNMMLEIPTQELIDLDDTVNTTKSEDISMEDVQNVKNPNDFKSLQAEDGTQEVVEKTPNNKNDKLDVEQKVLDDSLKESASIATNLPESGNIIERKSSKLSEIKNANKVDELVAGKDSDKATSGPKLNNMNVIDNVDTNSEEITPTEAADSTNNEINNKVVTSQELSTNQEPKKQLEERNSDLKESIKETPKEIATLILPAKTIMLDKNVEETIQPMNKNNKASEPNIETTSEHNEYADAVSSKIDAAPIEQKETEDCNNTQAADKTLKSKAQSTGEMMDILPVPDAQPSTSSQMAPDTEDAADVTDSLGLLAECSSAPVEEEDEEETSEHDDEDDDFEPDDEGSNLGPDQSEDSGQNSETDVRKVEESDHKLDGNSQVADKTLTPSDALFDALLDTTKELPDSNTSTDAIVKIASVATEENREDAEMDIEDHFVGEELDVAGENLIGDADPTVDEALDDALDAVLDEAEEEDKQAEEPPPPTVVDAAVGAKKASDVTAEPGRSTLRTLLEKKEEQPEESPQVQSKPGKGTQQSSGTGAVLSIVELEGSSSEDEVLEVRDKPAATTPRTTPRLNMSEISIKTTTSPKPPLVIPEARVPGHEEPKKKIGALEVFSLDSDEEEATTAAAAPPPTPKEDTDAKEEQEKETKTDLENETEIPKDIPPKSCINSACTSDSSEKFVSADGSVRAFYDCTKKKGLVCLPCLYQHYLRTRRLVEDVKHGKPLLQLETSKAKKEFVEILDSDSDEEADAAKDPDKEIISQPAILERQLADMINATWDKFNLQKLLVDAQDELMMEIDRLEKEGNEVNQMLSECQAATDRVRKELYQAFEPPRHQLPALVIHDAPDQQYTCLESMVASKETPQQGVKRQLSSGDINESKAKKPIRSTPAQADENKAPNFNTDPKPDDDKDVSVVHLSAEAAPPSLPPPGAPHRPPLAPALPVYAMRHAFGSWLRARLLHVTPKGPDSPSQQFSTCRVKFENKTNRNSTKVLPARCLAYAEPSNVRMTIGTRIIALFKDTSGNRRESFYSGVVAEVPNPVNSYRYLVFFDDGYAQYVQHADTRLVCESSSLVWEEVHPFSRDFVKDYLMAYPERPMVRLHTGQFLKTEWNGKWWTSRVVSVDASLVQVYFEQDRRTEWIYRGSTRLAPLYLELQAAERHRARRNRLPPATKTNMPYVEYTRSDEAARPDAVKAQQEEIRRQRAVAKKSTVASTVPPPAPTPAGNLDAVTSRVVYYTPKNSVRPHKMVAHTCGPRCRRTDVLSLKELRTYNPLAKPLLSGWERQIVRYKGHKDVMYRAPCGRRLRNMKELHRYLRLINSDMGVDLFDFGPSTHCLAEFVLNKCIVGKKDLSHGKENVPVPCVNYYDDSLPEFCSYNTERTPTAGVPLNLDPDFLCGCDCTDDCEDKSKCACWKLTLEGAHTIGLEGDDVGYVYKRLLEPLPSGIYECNVRCKCKSTCLNRVAQHPLQLKLQVFKTLNRGWGIRALNDVPRGAFLCIYAGNLLTDATANLDGLNEGDEYLAELDYIEVVEQMKEGYEEDIPEDAKKLDKDSKSESESESASEEEETKSKSDEEDTDFQPAYIPGAVTAFSKRLRKRKKRQKEEEEKEAQKKEAQKKEEDKKSGKDNEEDCITISDDEEIREPSRFAAQAGMGDEYISKHRSVRSFFGKDEACYIMDAKVQGNIGRYLNHSCSPNVFVQNVFVDTHDPRFPWVSFFALSHIRAGAELTWNYNYDVGSVPGKALYCYCGAANCRGRLL